MTPLERCRDEAGSGPRQEPDLLEKDAAVWDMVLNLVHPAFLYVLLQLLILSYLQDTPALRHLHPIDVPSLLLYLGQFFGAWAVFYTALMRDMGLRSPEGTFLILLALAGAGLQLLLFPTPVAAASLPVWIFLGAQGVAGFALWCVIFRRWRRCKAALRAGGEPRA